MSMRPKTMRPKTMKHKTEGEIVKNSESFDYHFRNKVYFLCKDDKPDQLQRLLKEHKDDPVLKNALEVTHMVNPNETNSIVKMESKTALSMAVAVNSVDCVKYLLEFGCNPNTVNLAGRTPISFCENNLSILETLMKAGADIYIKDRNGHTAFSRCKHEESFLKFLEWGLDVNTILPGGRNLLHLAVAASFSIQTLKYLIDLKVDLNRQDINGNSPLFLTKNLKIIEALTKGGADINIKNNGLSCFMNIFDEKCFNLYLSLGADVHAVGVKGNALHTAILSDYSKRTIQRLIHLKVDLNALNPSGDPAALLALKRYQFAVLTQIIDAGANLDIPIKNMTLLEYMLEYSFEDPRRNKKLKPIILKEIAKKEAQSISAYIGESSHEKSKIKSSLRI